ncbi:hypothetical protein G6F50_017462 [Rhizopus delemar]|uniref:Uncharacterized protein n=1 Tax=Rhizopus delemar TaxID=936053 RepID=A0A9P7C092_9FUNG|nr:hypothetical protein G6F50_017462 [Rhizopus delemar]
MRDATSRPADTNCVRCFHSAYPRPTASRMTIIRAVTNGPLPRLAGRALTESAGADAGALAPGAAVLTTGSVAGVLSVMTRLYSVSVRCNESSSNKSLEYRLVVGQADFYHC